MFVAQLLAALTIGKLENGMPPDDLAKRLDLLLSEIAALTSYVHSLQANVTSLRAEVQSGFKRVDDELNAAKIRDQDAHRLLKSGLEAREGLRESVEARFDEADEKHDEQLDLLKEAVHHLAAQRPRDARQ